MPYPPQPYPPVTRPVPVGCITVYQEYSSPPETVELEDEVFEEMTITDTDAGATVVTELAKDDISAQVRNPAVAQDFSDPTTDKSNWCLLSPGVNKDAYIQHSGSSDVTAAPLVPTENGLAFSDLESPMDVQHDSELETESGRGCDTTHRTLMETFSLLHYVIAFSHLSCLRHASPPTVLDSACSEIDHAPSSSQAGISASYGDDSPNELSNSSSLLMESASAAFVRPTSPLPPSSPGFINDYSTECPGYASISPLPSQHSPVPSSSPPDFFTSSPTRHDMYKSPPTSPGSAEKLTVAHSTVVSPNPLKRPYSPENDHNEGSGEQPAKKKKLNAHDPPQPKRSTHLFQHREHAKLKTPFRSPVTAATKDCPRYKDTPSSSGPDPPSSPTPFFENSATAKRSPPHKPGKDFMARVRTPRASAQFKSPLTAVAASSAGYRKRAVSASPNVQALQLRLQTLKRAVKIRNDGEGEKLERLAQKWTNVAREAAWEVWSVVKDNVQDVAKLGGGRGVLPSNWGWADEEKGGGAAGAERLSGEVEMLSEEDEPPIPEDTISMMLRKMGIDPGTLGWDEDEGEFLDVSS